MSVFLHELPGGVTNATPHELRSMKQKINEILPLLMGDYYPNELRTELDIINNELSRR